MPAFGMRRSAPNGVPSAASMRIVADDGRSNTLSPLVARYPCMLVLLSTTGCGSTNRPSRETRRAMTEVPDSYTTRKLPPTKTTSGNPIAFTGPDPIRMLGRSSNSPAGEILPAPMRNAFDAVRVRQTAKKFVPSDATRTSSCFAGAAPRTAGAVFARRPPS